MASLHATSSVVTFPTLPAIGIQAHSIAACIDNDTRHTPPFPLLQYYNSSIITTLGRSFQESKDHDPSFSHCLPTQLFAQQHTTLRVYVFACLAWARPHATQRTILALTANQLSLPAPPSYPTNKINRVLGPCLRPHGVVNALYVRSLACCTSL